MFFFGVLLRSCVLSVGVSWECLEGKVKKLEGKGNCVSRELGVRSVRGKSEQNFEGKRN